MCLSTEEPLNTALTADPDCLSTPRIVAVASADFQRRENFLRGCLWSVYSVHIE